MKGHDSQFFKHFLRVDQQQFYYVLDLVKNDISAKERLAVTLRYLATGRNKL